MSVHKSQETLFLHKPSRTLIVTDLIYNIQKNSDLLEQLYYRRFGAFGKPSICNYHRNFFRDTQEAWRIFQDVFKWDFDRLIMSHGEIVEKDGKKEFVRAWTEFFNRHFAFPKG